MQKKEERGERVEKETTSCANIAVLSPRPLLAVRPSFDQMMAPLHDSHTRRSGVAVVKNGHRTITARLCTVCPFAFLFFIAPIHFELNEAVAGEKKNNRKIVKI